MAQYGAKIRKMLKLAFEAPDETEGTAAFLQARKLMRNNNINITGIIRPDWGAGPLVEALQQVGTTKLPSGNYVGRTIADVIEADPTYLINLHNAGGFRSEVVNKDLKIAVDAYLAGMFCQYGGDWGDSAEDE